MTVRTLLTTPTTFYCNTATGSLSYDGLSATVSGSSGPLPQPQDVLNRLASLYDLGYQNVTIIGADGQSFRDIFLANRLVGQAGAEGLVFICGSAFGLSAISPAGPVGGVGTNCVAVIGGGALTIENMTADGSAQIAAGSYGQDVITVGQNSMLRLRGSNRAIQAIAPGAPYIFNHITINGCSRVETIPGASGNGHLYLRGNAQCGAQLDNSSTFEAECNGVHGMIAFHAESTPYWTDAFVDYAVGCKVNLSGVDFHGPSSGYQYRSRDGGAMFLNLAGDPTQLVPISNSALFGSAGMHPASGPGYLS